MTSLSDWFPVSVDGQNMVDFSERTFERQEWSVGIVSLFCCGEKTLTWHSTLLPPSSWPAAPLTQYQLSVLTATSQCSQAAILQSFMTVLRFCIGIVLRHWELKFDKMQSVCRDWHISDWQKATLNPSVLIQTASYHSLVSPVVNYWAIIQITK